MVAPTRDITWQAINSRPVRLPIFVFPTKAVPRDGLRFLRFLQVVFPPFGEHDPRAFCPPQKRRIARLGPGSCDCKTKTGHSQVKRCGYALPYGYQATDRSMHLRIGHKWTRRKVTV